MLVQRDPQAAVAFFAHCRVALQIHLFAGMTHAYNTFVVIDRAWRQVCQLSFYFSIVFSLIAFIDRCISSRAARALNVEEAMRIL